MSNNNKKILNVSFNDEQFLIDKISSELMGTKMNILEQILDAYPDENFLKADGFDEAIIGVESESYRLVYSIPKCIQIIITDNELNYEDATEHFYYNVAGSYVGETTPIWVNDNFNL